MSDEQQQAAIGRTVEEYLASKKKLATLLAEANAVGNMLTAIGHGVRTLPQSNPSGGHPALYVSLDRHSSEFPTIASLRSLASEVDTEVQTKNQLRGRLKDMGFEPKD